MAFSRTCLPRFGARIVAAAGLLGLSSAALAVDFPEMEPNDTKAAAQVISGMAPGDTITGFSTGSSTTAAGPGSADYYDVTTTSAGAPGIYRYELTITTTGTAGHVSTIRGLTQTAGVINPGTDATIQTALTTASGVIPARTVVWYANENPSRIVYRVAGTASTTADYVATLNRTAVVPALGPSLVPGSITIARSGHTNDTDFWVYNAVTGAPVPDFGNDDPNTMTRSFSAGDYILAVSNFNLANNQPAATGETFLSGAVMDFDNAVAGSSTAATTNLAMSIGGTPVPLTKSHAFQIMFAYFQVAVPPGPYFTATSATPNPVVKGTSTLLSATVADGPNGPATTVTGDLTAFGLSAAEAFSDPEPDGIWTYTLNVPIGQGTGTFGVALTATDSAAQTGAGNINVQVIPPPPANDLCVNAVPVTPGSYVGDLSTATNDGTASCGASTTSRDVWFLFTAPSAGNLIVSTCGTHDLPGLDLGVDTVLSFHTGCPGLSANQVAGTLPVGGCNDDANTTGNTCAAVGGPSDGGVLRDSLLRLNAMTPGQQVWIRVCPFSTGTGGPFALNVVFDVPTTGACCIAGVCTPGLTEADCLLAGGAFQGIGSSCTACLCVTVANNECAGATAVSVGTNPGTSACATTSLTITPVAQCPSGLSGSGGSNDVWHSFVAPATTTYDFTTCDAVGFDTVLAVYDACPADGTVAPLACNDDLACSFSGLRSTINDLPLTGGSTYYIRIAGYGSTGGATGAYVLTINQDAPPTGRCCTTGPASCSITDAAGCATLGGTFGGSGTACDGWTNDVFTNNPTVCCAANYNGVGGVTVQDIYDFLADWNAVIGGGSPSVGNPDYNGVDGVTVQDIYDFLAAWSAGCPPLP